MWRALAVLALVCLQSVQVAEASSAHSPYSTDGYYLAMELMENRCASQVGKFMHASRTKIEANNVDLGDIHGTDTPGTLGLNVPVAAQGVQGFPYGHRHLLSKPAPNHPVQLDLTEEGYRREICTTAAALVDQYCVGAPDDRGVSSVQPWLMGLGCTAVLPGINSAPVESAPLEPVGTGAPAGVADAGAAPAFGK